MLSALSSPLLSMRVCVRAVLLFVGICAYKVRVFLYFVFLLFASVQGPEYYYFLLRLSVVYTMVWTCVCVC